MQIRPLQGETTISYATRLREKAHKCEFGERILEHLIQTHEKETVDKEMHHERMVIVRISERSTSVGRNINANRSDEMLTN